MTANDGGGVGRADVVDVEFSHVQLYADRVLPVEEYESLERSIDALEEDGGTPPPSSRSGGNAPSGTAATFAPHGRDVVKQLIAGLGFRVSGRYDGGGTRSVLVTSSDPDGIRIVVTAKESSSEAADEEEEKDPGEGETDVGGYRHFDADNVDRFYEAHSDRQGIAVLAFEVGRRGTTDGSSILDGVVAKYSSLHPALVPPEYQNGPISYDGEGRVFEAYAYYAGEGGRDEEEQKEKESGKEGETGPKGLADVGTRLRFVEPCSGDAGSGGCGLPGIAPVPAAFPPSSRSAYFDHWVSNVVSRTGFLETLEDVLSFTPKVDFNAGVVAAGEAQIESTVTGNTSAAEAGEKDGALRDRSQIYLPINNALTKVGHVHGFLEEIGQGVQHVASRVGDIVDFVQRANDRRKMFGEGFTFLKIPRSYYGILTVDLLIKGPRRSEVDPPVPEKGLLSPGCAVAVLDACVEGRLLHDDEALLLDTSADVIGEVLDARVPTPHMEEYERNRAGVVEAILHSRYSNLYNLLRDHLSEESYVAIVRNQILVDVQGEDLLFQIFTSNILQRKSGDEAPFFEFIQRVCSECVGPDGCPKKVKPGCGGFGIRNFLTLFLSVEITKAMLEASNARDRGDASAHAFSQSQVDLFTKQLNESNPLLTEISDAMTREGIARDKMAASCQEEKEDGGDFWRLAIDKESLAKARANEKLMECNLKYQRLMKELRESHSV